MGKALKVLYITPEVQPLVKTGGLADVSAALPAALAGLGLDVRLLIPGYPAVLDRLVLRCVRRSVPLLPGLAPARLLSARMPDTGVVVYVLESAALYARDGGPYLDAAGRDWPDNHLRFGALCRLAAQFGGDGVAGLWRPDIVHCNDWQGGLTAAYLVHAARARAPVVMSAHNMAFPGRFPRATLQSLGLPRSCFTMHGVEFHGDLSFLKAGLYYADHITTVSETYAREIQTARYGCGFEGLLAARAPHLSGIMNGIDTRVWDPASDPHIAAPYHAGDLGGKARNKRALQRRLGLRADAAVPLLGMVSRLTAQKGVDLLLDALPEFAGESLQCAILGSGEAVIERRLGAQARALPGRMSVTLGYDEALAHQIEAGADLFVMPSRFEPCGLNQMYSMRYGTPPLVRRTGGLADSVVDATPGNRTAGTATGFVFEEPAPLALGACLRRALALYRDAGAWRAVQENGMRKDFGWPASAARYASVYARLATR